MKKLYLLVPFIIFYSLQSSSQTFEKLFSQISTDAFRSVEVAPAGGYILAGYTADSSVSDTDAFVVRMNVMGDTMWTIRYNGLTSKKDLLYKISPMPNGNFLACGYTTSVTNQTEDLLYMEIDANGQILWTKTWGGTGRERGQDVIRVSNGNILIAGYTSSAPAQYFDAFLLMCNSTGDTLWSRRYGSGNYDDANCVRELATGGFVFGGQSGNGTNGLDQYLVRTAFDGSVIWSKKFGTTETDNIESIVVTADAFYLAGSTSWLGGYGGDDGYVVRTDTSGTIIWAKIFGGNQPDDFHRVDITTDNNLILSGTTSSSGPFNPNMWLVKATLNGDSLWSKTYGGDNHDHGYSATETADGGFIFAGYSGSFDYYAENAYVVKTDANGEIVNNLKYVSAIAITNPTNVSCAGNIQIKVLIRNWGNDTLPNVPVTVEITGATTQTLNGLYNGAFYPQDVDTVLITTPINTIPGQTYTFFAYATTDNDVIPNRNSTTTTVTMDGFIGTPTSTNTFVCGSTSVDLSASVTAGTLYWFADQIGGIALASGTTFTTPAITQTTTFYVQAGLNCASARVPVTVNYYPGVSIDLGPADTVITSGSIILDPGPGFNSYLWSTGETTQTIQPLGTDTFCVTVSDANGCSASDCIFIDNTTAVSTVSSTDFTLYPNPANSYLNISFGKNYQNGEIELYNSTGSVLMKEKFLHQESATIQLKDFAPGIYFVRLRTDGEERKLKFVVE